MTNHEHDGRAWISTDRLGERMTIAQALPGVELLSARGSTRHWTEAHTSFTLAMVAPNQPRVVARWRTRGRELSTAAGELMAIEPGEMHVTRAVTAAADFDVLKVSPALIDEARRGMDRRVPFHFRASAAVDDAVTGAMHRLVATHAEGADDIEVESAHAALLEVVFNRLSESSSLGVTPDPVRDFRLRRAREYLRARSFRKPTLDELSAETGISKYWLCSRFRAAYGVTIGQYWSAFRLSEAAERLKRGAPIRTVCAELGFVDECYFSRQFKRHWGCPPGAWHALLVANRRRNRPFIEPRTRGVAPRAPAPAP